MPKNVLNIQNIDIWTGKPIKDKKKRRNVSFTEKAILWDKNKGHMCHICKGKIHSLTEAQVDHVRAHSKGGKRIAWAHSGCNKFKGSKPLSQIHKRLGVYKPKKRKSTKKKRQPSYKIYINPFTGQKEKKKKE